MSVDTIAGGWTKYRKLTPEDRAVFDEAMAGFVGVIYDPYEVATQVVAGTNYRYKCNARLPGPEECMWEAVVEIFQPLEGKPYLVNINRV
ncbi:hypothetical protein [Vibrio quintilis]|uniref:Uncharacterized protein n=1 Tax=Vibrio quintilis TaxID=1117707 RepID=A0A1M7YXE4_9VIBR|nr:hypothetical protein [Vibrio quintilis]SHO57311.1 hypothetical protein VQ7734_03080 [Vibrio quintilis]